MNLEMQLKKNLNIMAEENNTLEKLEPILNKLLANNPNITIAIIVSIEGLPILSIITSGSDETKISAMVVTLLSLSKGLELFIISIPMRRV
jgi:hypothetical protein